MSVDLVYGINADSFEEGVALVQTAIGLKGELRYSEHVGGTYVLFKQEDVFQIKVFTNLDVQDDEPVSRAAEEWLIAMTVSAEDRQSLIVRALEQNPDKFELVYRKEYERRSSPNTTSGQ